MNIENSKNFQINCKLYKCKSGLCKDHPLAYVCSMKQFSVLQEMHFCNAIVNYEIAGYSETVYYPNDSPRFDRRIWRDAHSNQPSPYFHMSTLIFSINDIVVEPWKQEHRVNGGKEPKLFITPTNLTLYNADWKLIPNTNRTFDVNIEGFLDNYKTNFFKDMFNALMEIQCVHAIK